MIDYDLIPEGAADETIAQLLKEFLQKADQMISEKGLHYTLERLESIAEKETISEYEAVYINAISDFVNRYLDYNDPVAMDIILTIVFQMHLTSVWQQISRKNNLNNKSVEELINDAKKENDRYLYFRTDE